ncbi:DUF7344 domain-containing protein [Geoglobus sp.]
MANLSEILGNERRMLTVIYLLKNDGRGSVSDITEYICEKSNNTSGKFRKSVYVSLMQTHIPTLERAGLVERERDVVFIVNSKLFEDLLSFLESFGSVFR